MHTSGFNFLHINRRLFQSKCKATFLYGNATVDPDLCYSTATYIPPLVDEFVKPLYSIIVHPTSNKSFIKFLKEFFDVLQMKDIIGKWGHGLV